MQARIAEGMAMLVSLGAIIQDEGYENNGNILIQPLDYKKFRLIEHVLAYMGFDALDEPYEFLYNDDYYLLEKRNEQQQIFNRYKFLFA